MSESKPDYETGLSDAVEFFRQNSGAKHALVARNFEVSRDTLRRRVNGGRPAQGRPATVSNLSKAEEEALCDYVDSLIKLQLPVFKIHVTDAANSIIKEHSSKLDTQPHTVGLHWTTRFLLRHKYTAQRLQVIAKKRKAAENTENVLQWFGELEFVLEHYGILPEDIWKIDETGFRISFANSEFVVTREGNGRGWNPSACLFENRDSVTVIEAVSASANVRPALVVSKGRTPSQNNVSVTGRFLQLSKVLSIEDAPHMRMHEL